MTEENKSRAQQLIDMGENFQPDAMADFDERTAKGEFDNMTIEQIRQKYIGEAIDEENEEEELETLRELEEDEERRLDRELDGDDDDD